jgi:hypothetical protein
MHNANFKVDFWPRNCFLNCLGLRVIKELQCLEIANLPTICNITQHLQNFQQQNCLGNLHNCLRMSNYDLN